MLTLPLELVGVGGGSGCWMLGPYCACVSALNKHTGTLATYTYIRVCMRIAISKVFYIVFALEHMILQFLLFRMNMLKFKIYTLVNTPVIQFCLLFFWFLFSFGLLKLSNEYKSYSNSFIDILFYIHTYTNTYVYHQCMYRVLWQFRNNNCEILSTLAVINCH